MDGETEFNNEREMKRISTYDASFILFMKYYFILFILIFSSAASIAKVTLWC